MSGGSRAGTSVLGDDWLQNLTLIRNKLESFLEKKKLTRESFCFDVLKDLYSDYIDPQCKVHLLLLLQENSHLLLQNTTLLEQISGSLLNLFHLLKNREDKRLLKSQILIAITTILLDWEIEDECFQKLTTNHKAFLLEILHSPSEDPLITSMACKCLEEIEVFHPNILKTDLSSILVTSEKHMSPAAQSYVLLLSLVTKQAAEETHLKIESSKVEEESSAQKQLTTPSTPEEKVDYLHMVSYLLEQLPLMSPPSVYRVLKNLIPVVKSAPELSANTFRRFIPSLIVSSDVPLFHLSFELLMEFGSELYSPQEQQKLLKQLISSATNPCLSSSHRLLFLEWLKSFAGENGSLSKLPFSDLNPLLPSPYDGPVTQEKKLYILCQTIPFESQENTAVDFLNDALSGLRKCALLPGANKAAVSFFRVLFVYFSCKKSDIMYNTVFKLLVDIIKTSPHLSPYALNFLNCVKTELQENTFYVDAMGNLVDHFLSLPIKQVTSNLSNYLAVLCAAAEEAASVCKPRTLLKRLQLLLKEPNPSTQYGWSFGNDILSICRTFLKFHDVQLFFYDLAEVLCLVTKNISDVDVKNRSKLYYSTLTSLSKGKMQTMFKLQSCESDRNKSLTTFVNESGSSLKFAGSIQILQQPILQLEKVEKKIKIKKCEEMIISDTVEFENDILKDYQSSLLHHQPSVTIPFILKSAENVEETFSILYGIVITTHTVPACESSTIEIPVFQLKKQSDKELMVFLELFPKHPYPLKLEFKAEFTCSNCCTYSCDITSVALEFEDLFLPLPIPQSLHSVDSYKPKLFSLMWDAFMKNSLEETETKYYKSVFRPDMPLVELTTAIQQKFEPFIFVQSIDTSIAIFVPPLYHILMKITIVNEMPFIHILVDEVTLLSWLNQFLKKLGTK